MIADYIYRHQSALRTAGVGAAIIVATALGGLLSPYNIGLLTQVLIYGIFAMSLDLLLGYTGQPSLGHAAYFGLAGYVAAIVSLRLSFGFLSAAATGLLAAVLAAALFNLLALRTAKAYYLMITLAFSQVLYSVAVSWTGLTGGDNGLSGLTRPDLVAWVPWHATSNHAFFYFVVIVFLLSLLSMYVFVKSPVGYALRGIRENENRMQALGYNSWRYKYLVALVAAFFAGLSGELLMYFNNFISPSALSVTLSAQVLMMILVGAAGTLFGPILGAAIFVFLQYVMSNYTERWLFIIGVIYVFVALYAPDGAVIFVLQRLGVRRRLPP